MPIVFTHEQVEEIHLLLQKLSMRSAEEKRQHVQNIKSKAEQKAQNDSISMKVTRSVATENAKIAHASDNHIKSDDIVALFDRKLNAGDKMQADKTNEGVNEIQENSSDEVLPVNSNQLSLKDKPLVAVSTQPNEAAVELVKADENKNISNVGNNTSKPESNVNVNERICPKCGATLVLRTAKKGNNVGERFWGCSRFPQCHYTSKN